MKGLQNKQPKIVLGSVQMLRQGVQYAQKHTHPVIYDYNGYSSS